MTRLTPADAPVNIPETNETAQGMSPEPFWTNPISKG